MYVTKDEHGKITGAFNEQQSFPTIFLPADDPDLIRFLKGPDPPLPISDRQFYQALALAGAITKEEALAAVKSGEIPAQIAQYIDAISDPNEQFAARMLLAGATQFDRKHPLVENFGHALGWDDEHIDELWRTAIRL